MQHTVTVTKCINRYLPCSVVRSEVRESRLKPIVDLAQSKLVRRGLYNGLEKSGVVQGGPERVETEMP